MRLWEDPWGLVLHLLYLPHPSPIPSPLHCTQGLFLFLFGRTLYFELDVDGEMQKGSLPGAISLAHKFVPASKAVLGRTLEAVQVGLGRKGGA